MIINDFIKAIFLGIIEGLTEFIPVSSTGHLILFSKFLKFQSGNIETFSISIQLGAILAVVFLYRNYFKQFITPKNWINKQALLIIVASFPILILGFFSHHFIKTYLFSPNKVIFALFVGGLMMIFVEKKFTPKKSVQKLEDISIKQAIIIGVFQCMALFPGMSRSASTIMGGLIGGLNYSIAAQFSFIIAVPVMFIAVIYDLIQTFYLLTLYDLGLILVGFVVSFIVALIAISTFIKLLQKVKLMPFAIYRIVIALLLLLFI